MVCPRCIRAVGQVLQDAGLEAQTIHLGEVVLKNPATPAQMTFLRQALTREGFELLDDENSRLVEQIKTLIISEIHHGADKKTASMNFSDFLSAQTGHHYSQLSKLFSAVEGATIEKYIIAQKIERVKELLVYGELSLGEIAWETGYSSSQHLSRQFHQITGITPSQFKQERGGTARKSLDQL